MYYLKRVFCFLCGFFSWSELVHMVSKLKADLSNIDVRNGLLTEKLTRHSTVGAAQEEVH